MARADRDLRQSDMEVFPRAHLRMMSYARKAIIQLKIKLPYCPILTEKMAFSYAKAGCIYSTTGQLQKAKRRLFKASIHFETAINHPLYKQSGYEDIHIRYRHTLETLIIVLDQLGEREHMERLQTLLLEHHLPQQSPETVAKIFSAAQLPTPSLVRQWITQSSGQTCSQPSSDSKPD